MDGGRRLHRRRCLLPNRQHGGWSLGPRQAGGRQRRRGRGGLTLAHNVASPAEVDAVVDEARAAGATVSREPAETFWGGYSGVFVDPDGHPWEVAHNPGWLLRPDGTVELP